ncbi:hypothetical protein FOY91_07580 [Sphingomonas solaris]|uniref:Uncharacterized protein n=1 Tax=Alterirhizorhabdus solaris TaxID=2529389 RepID=A0A558R7D2_9SPHN|nr:hypothetical protein FOY91_07580 [Sphingomonas solaris]
MASACSTAPPPSRTASVSPHLLAPPPMLPQVARTAEGAMDGRQCLSSALDLYDVAGGIRGAMIELQREVGMRLP